MCMCSLKPAQRIMSILQYLKPKNRLPDPNGSLSQSLSSQAITKVVEGNGDSIP